MSQSRDKNHYICHMTETKNKILEAAIALWSQDLGTSLDDIAKHVGVSRRTLHRHYQGREDLVKNVMEHLIKTYLASIEELLSEKEDSIENQLKKLFINDVQSADMHLVCRNLRTYEFLDFNAKDKNVQRVFGLYHSVFNTLKNSGLIAEDYTVEWLEAFYSSVIEAAIKKIKAGNDDEEYLFMAWRSFWNGIKK
ncbi:TetR/AcrR family transcriptional regulator [Prolixibacteraceae bacterium JC049]|nr:TetR/AcrR family transcriptional regulator [Prolixibacteraceae bacterium JC049]